MKLIVYLLKVSAVALILCQVMRPIASAGVVTTIEAAGAQTTNLPGAVTETFNSIGTGNYHSLTTDIGSLTTAGSFEIVKADLYGGAGGTGNYFAIGAQSGSGDPVTLTFNGPESSFGMWWSAADSNNTVSIYSGTTLEARYTTSSLLGSLGSSYNGNPTANFYGQDSGEKFAYINFSDNGGPAFTSVVFSNSNSTGTGFELDNLSVVAAVPEPSAMILGATGVAFVGMAWVGLSMRKRRLTPVAG